MPTRSTYDWHPPRWLCSTPMPCERQLSESSPVTKRVSTDHSCSNNSLSIQLDIGHVTIWFTTCHFLLVVHWNQASISNHFRTMGPQNMIMNTRTHTLTNKRTNQQTQRITIPPISVTVTVSHYQHVTGKSSRRPQPLPRAALPQRVTWRHRAHDHLIPHMPFPIGAPLWPILYLQPFSRYSAPTNVNEHTHTHQQTRRIAIPPSGGKLTGAIERENKLSLSVICTRH